MELRLAWRFAAPRHFGFCSSQTSPEAFPGDLRVLPLQKGKPQIAERSPRRARKPPPGVAWGAGWGAGTFGRARLAATTRVSPQESERLRSDSFPLEDHPRENYSSVKRPRALWRLGDLRTSPSRDGFLRVVLLVVKPAAVEPVDAFSDGEFDVSKAGALHKPNRRSRWANQSRVLRRSSPVKSGQ